MFGEISGCNILLAAAHGGVAKSGLGGPALSSVRPSVARIELGNMLVRNKLLGGVELLFRSKLSILSKGLIVGSRTVVLGWLAKILIRMAEMPRSICVLRRSWVAEIGCHISIVISFVIRSRTLMVVVGAVVVSALLAPRARTALLVSSTTLVVLPNRFLIVRRRFVSRLIALIIIASLVPVLVLPSAAPLLGTGRTVAVASAMGTAKISRRRIPPALMTLIST